MAFVPSPPSPENGHARVARKHLICGDGSRVRINSPNLAKGFAQTGITLDQLRAKAESEFRKDGALKEVGERRHQAYEALRLHHWQLVMNVRQRFLDESEAVKKAAALAKAEGKRTPSPGIPDVDAALKAEQERMKEALAQDRTKMAEEIKRAEDEQRAALAAAAEQERLMRDLEARRRAQKEAIRKRRHETENERKRRERERREEEERRRQEMHRLQAEREQRDEEFSEEWAERERQLQQQKLGFAKQQLSRVQQLQEEKEIAAERQLQQQAEDQAKMVAQEAAHAARVDKYQKAIKARNRQHGEEVERKLAAVKQHQEEYSNELADRERQERLAASQRLRGLNKALSSVDSAQRAVESEWNDRRKRILARHAESAKRREEELYEHGAQKLKRLDEIGYIRKSSQVLRAEESKLRRNERNDHVLRMKRIKETQMSKQIDEMEEKERKQAQVRAAKNEIKSKRKQMVMQFFVERKKMKEKKKDAKMLQVGL